MHETCKEKDTVDLERNRRGCGGNKEDMVAANSAMVGPIYLGLMKVCLVPSRSDLQGQKWKQLPEPLQYRP